MTPMQDDTPAIHRRLAAAQLPALPQILLQVVELCEREDAGLAEIAERVCGDAAITARIVSIAHSPYYNRGRSPETLDQCLAVLGTATVRRIAMNQAVIELFGRFQGTRQVDLGQFWRHSLTAAVLARQLAERFAYANTDEAYLAGLLHDVGRLALLSTLPDAYAPLFAAGIDERLLAQQERSRFAMDHAEAGAWLAQHWQMHPFFADSLHYHHEPAVRVRSAHPLVQIVALADLMSDLPPESAAEQSETLALWDIDAESARALIERAAAEVKAIAEQFDIPLPDAQRPAASTQSPDERILARLAKLTSTHLLARDAMPAESLQASMEEVYAALAQSASLLFGTRKAAFFLPEDGVLRGHSPDGRDPRIEEIRIRLPAPNSVIGRAYDGAAEILHEGGATGSLADIHVRHLLEGEALLCLPLAYAHIPLGVLVLALDAARAEMLAQRAGLLAAFASEAGRHFHQARQHIAELAEARHDMAERFSEQARRVIHEASNPLGVVRNYLALLRQRLAEQPGMGQDIDLMEDELRRVNRIIQGLRQIDTSVGAGRSRVDINALIEEVLRICRAGKPQMQQVETLLCLDERLEPFTTDRDKLKQILVNLIFNAVEAMPQGGRLTLSSAQWKGGKGGDSVEITVADTGLGIPSEVMRQLYSPVQTSKGAGHAGLGLSIVGALVEELGGTIQCKSSSAGTSFKLTLPLEP